MSMFGASQMSSVVFVFMVGCGLVVGVELGHVFEGESVVFVDEVLCEGFVDFVCGCGVVVGFNGVVHVFCEDVCECFDCSVCRRVEVDVGGVIVECDGDVFHLLPFRGFVSTVPYVVVFVVVWCVWVEKVPSLFKERGEGVWVSCVFLVLVWCGW